MNEEENIQRNVNRVNTRLKPLVNDYTKKQKEVFKDYKILKDGTECTLDDIDFSQSNIFICKEDFLSYIAYYGLLKVNDIRFPDPTLSGKYSMIKKSYMIIDSTDIRFSKIPMDSFYDVKRDGMLPDSWNSINYITKDICIWRLVSYVGIGDNEKMYDGCYSWVSERYWNGKLDWLFYIGTYESFKKEYTGIANLTIPVYQIVFKGIKVTKAIKITDNKNKLNDIF